MAIVDMVMPKMGESIMEGTVLTWLKKVGEAIAQDESVLEVATDKVDTEVPSTHAGILLEILAQEGDVVAVGAAIARIETGGTAATGLEKESAVAPSGQKASLAVASLNTSAVVEVKSSSARFYSPLVMSIAKEEGIGMAELEAIIGTGKEERVTKGDLLDYLAKRGAALTPVAKAVVAASPSAPTAPSGPSLAAKSIMGGDEIIEMDRMRKMIAGRMLDSKRISPHVTSFVEADVTNVVLWRSKVKGEFHKKEGDVLTFTPIFMEAVAKALKDYPMVNVQVDGDRIIKKKAINISLAVALPSGNLIVPVVHNADQYSITGLAHKVNDLARRARENKLTPDDLANGTYTVSNVGSFGNVMGTPIINQPQVAILALGAIQKKPAVLETPTGDVIAIRL